VAGAAVVLLYLSLDTKGGNTMDNYSSIDRAGGYIALFLVGLIGWTCDQVSAVQSALVAHNFSKQGARK
jgi:hypothetical protein